ncbi:MAG: Cobalamin-binding protein precursor [Methanocella sp. PtaU1.Bin125]|nr:MAG: Cobalamin-binding protein precursor [Methanocella sp. PtaU1.Bin125]
MAPVKLLIFIVPLLLCIVMVSGCTSSPPRGNASTQAAGTMFPVSLTDDLNRTLTFAGPPQRVVSLAPSNTEILYGLGLGDRIVGVDVYSDYPDEAKSKPKMGGMINVSEDAVIAARPDLVLVGQFTPVTTVGNLCAAKIKVFSAHPDNVSDTYRTVKMFGDLFGVPDRAQQLLDTMRADVRDVTSLTSGLNDSSIPSVLVIITPGDTCYVADKDGYMGDLIAIAGGRNVATGPIMTPSEIAAADPDMIIVPLTGWTVTTFDSLRNGKEPWMQDLAAVKNGKVYSVDYDLAGRPGPRMGAAARMMAETIHPELYAKKSDNDIKTGVT